MWLGFNMIGKVLENIGFYLILMRILNKYLIIDKLNLYCRLNKSWSLCVM